MKLLMPSKESAAMSTSASPGKHARPGPEPRSPIGRSHDLLVALRRIIRAIDLQSKRLARSSGLTIPQLVVLQSIRDLGEVTGRQIAGHVSLSQGTMTTILDRLERRGLIERYRSSSDRRIVHARLTREGRRLIRKAPPLLQAQLTRRFEALGAGEQARIVATLEQVAALMGAAELDAAPLLDPTERLGVEPPAADGAAGAARTRPAPERRLRSATPRQS